MRCQLYLYNIRFIIGIIVASSITIIGVIGIAIIIAIFVLAAPSRKLQQQLNLGDKYITELDYDNAIVAYQNAIDINPKSEEAYIGLANVYLISGDYMSALEVLNDGYIITESERINYVLNNINTNSTVDNSYDNFISTNDDDVDDSIMTNYDVDIVELADASTGDYVYFGACEQHYLDSPGPTPIEWYVLDIQDGSALLISRYVLDVEPYNNDMTDITWEECSLRQWLNSDFYNDSFNSLEKSMIQNTLVENSDNPVWKTNGGNDTIDKIFCLSVDELRKYYTFNSWDDDSYEGYCEDLIAEGTIWACDSKVLWKNTITQQDYNDKLVEENYSVNVIGKTGAEWWLRSPGISSQNACYVDEYGGTNYYGHGNGVTGGGVGVRPALWVSIE